MSHTPEPKGKKASEGFAIFREEGEYDPPLFGRVSGIWQTAAECLRYVKENHQFFLDREVLICHVKRRLKVVEREVKTTEIVFE